MAFILDYAKQKAAGYLTTGIQAGGTLAGNAVGGVGSLIEDSGKSFAEGVKGGISGVGNYINGYGNGIKGSMAADGPVGAGGGKKVAVRKGDGVGTARSKGVGRSVGSPAGPKGVTQGKVVAKKVMGAPAGKAVGSGAKGTGVPAATPRAVVAKKGPTPAKTGPQVKSQGMTGKVKISPESRPRPAVKAA